MEINDILTKYKTINSQAKALLKIVEQRDFVYDDILFDPICYTEDQSEKLNAFLNIIDTACSTPEGSDTFFRAVKSQSDFEEKSYIVGHWIYGQPGSIRAIRINNYDAIINKFNELCKRQYGCNWGEQKIKEKVFDVSKIRQYTPWFKFDRNSMKLSDYLHKLAKNRPVYVGEKFVGYCKELKNTLVVIGHQKSFDEEECENFDVPTHGISKCIVFYEDPSEIIKRIKSNKIPIFVQCNNDDVKPAGKKPIFYDCAHLGYTIGLYFSSTSFIILDDRIYFDN